MDYGSDEYYITSLSEVFEFIKHNYLIGLDFTIYKIDNMNIVLNIMDDLIMYIGVRDKEYIFVEELTYNNYFKINKSKFFPYNNKYDYPILTKYRTFDGEFPEDDNYFSKKSSFKYVDCELPELKLKERIDNWEGILYNFIIYELEYNDSVGYAITSTTDKLPLKYAYNVEKVLEDHAFGAIYPLNDKFCKENELVAYGNFMYTEDFTRIANLMDEDNLLGKYNPKSFVGGRTPIFESHLKYFCIPIYLKKTIDEFYTQKHLLVKCKEGFYSDIDKIKFEVGNYKWKSEELMYKCIKEVFKDCTIVQQYRPFYLSTPKGQMSYDVYVVEKKIAFEYQGKQHYEPVEFFGGKENFENQKKRDELKRNLSKKNKIKLVEISYLEDISVDLIRKKIE